MVIIGLNPRDITEFDAIKRLQASPHVQIFADKVKELMGPRCYSCFSEEHTPVLEIVKRRLGIDLQIPRPPMKHKLREGDQVIIILVNHIRRLTEGESYTREEIRKAQISFRLYTFV